MNTLFQLQAATTAARKRTGDTSISTRADSGRVQVVRVTFGANGKSTVTPVSEFLPAAEAVAFLDAMQ